MNSMPNLRITTNPEEMPRAATANSTKRDNGKGEIIGIHPNKLQFGVVSVGFYYILKLSVQNNSLSPIRIRVTCEPYDDEPNEIRVVDLPDKVAPGMIIPVSLELSAENVRHSMFTLKIVQNADSRIYTRPVEANIVSRSSFRYVKKSLVLQKRPIFRPNVSQAGTLPGGDGFSAATPVTSFSETMLLDDEDVEDLLEIPMSSNMFWDPFEKVLRLDPQLGKVVVDQAFTLEEALNETALRRFIKFRTLNLYVCIIIFTSFPIDIFIGRQD